jgi:hypothetical protein
MGDGTTKKGGIVVSPRPTTTRCGLGATSAQQGSVAADGPGGGHDIVFTFYGETWTNAVPRDDVSDGIGADVMVKRALVRTCQRRRPCGMIREVGRAQG